MKSHVLRQCYTALAVAINMVSNGLYLGYAAVIIPSLRHPGSGLHATLAEESWIAAVSGISQIIGNIIVSPILNGLGRRRSHIITTIPIIINWLMILMATEVYQIIIARFIGGFSMGFICPLGPMIIGEMTEPKHRGALLTTISLSITTGVVICQGLASVLTWHQIAWFSLSVSFSSLILVLYTKESPPWLLSKGKIDECIEIYRWLRGSDAIQEVELQEMIRKQTIILQKNTKKSSKYTEQFRNFMKYLLTSMQKKEFYKPLIIMFHIHTMLQFSGLPTIISYTQDIIQNVMSSKTNIYVWMFVLNIERLLCSFLAIYLIKKLKRRSLLWLTGCGCVFSFSGLGVTVIAKENGLINSENTVIPGALLIFYMMSIGSGFFALVFAIPGEIFPLEYRSVGSSLSLFVGSISLFASIKCFPGLVSTIGLPYTNFIFSGIVVYCLIFVYFTLPETKDRTLQEIEDEFRGQNYADVITPLNQPAEANLEKLSP